MDWMRSLIWMDYRLVALVGIGIPLVLLIWSLVKQSVPLIRLMLIYWRVASLLIISLYLMIGGAPIGFVSSLSARILIPISLWFWIDLNEEIEDMPPSRALKLAFTAWRWAVTVFMGVGAIAQLPSLQCAFSPTKDLIQNDFCRLWLEAPWAYKQLFHNATSERFLGFIGILGLLIYVTYLSYFVLIRLGKQGRTAVSS
ncbi:DUF3177 family protein [Roseofilum sp. BLCC_M154]|uniref:DUF3177 family protein n=1 Tax=Roseofilum acuticapitatum BLCC-M154 TaxID=3022444 RepID=A0ABT7AQJ2_9CYAN|nr:DUF3177 family protein [Roseofilum acuticapitatum]MDJ1169168.1 DUF3177 family protein [Roseofilum acuticapitatum BLCC-M154]